MKKNEMIEMIKDLNKNLSELILRVEELEKKIK